MTPALVPRRPRLAYLRTTDVPSGYLHARRGRRSASRSHGDVGAGAAALDVAGRAAADRRTGSSRSCGRTRRRETETIPFDGAAARGPARATASRTTTSSRRRRPGRCAACICPRSRPTAATVAFAALNSLWLARQFGRRAATQARPGRRPPAISSRRRGRATGGRCCTRTTGTGCSRCAGETWPPARRRCSPPAAGCTRRSHPTARGSPASTWRATSSSGTSADRDRAGAGRAAGRRRAARPAQLVARRPLPRVLRPQPAQPPLPRGLQPHPGRRHRRPAKDRLHPVAAHVSLADRYDSGPVWSPDGRWMAVIVESALWLLPVGPTAHRDGAPRTPDRRERRPPVLVRGLADPAVPVGRELRLIGVDGGPARTVRCAARPAQDPRPATPSCTPAGSGTAPATRVREDVDIVVRAGAITAVEPHRATRGRAARRIDASERTVVPGLWDAHTHPWQVTYGGRQTAAPARVRHHHRRVSCGGFAYEQARIREAVAAGRARRAAAADHRRTARRRPGRVQHGAGPPHPGRAAALAGAWRRAGLGLRQDLCTGAGLGDGGGGPVRPRAARRARRAAICSRPACSSGRT